MSILEVKNLRVSYGVIRAVRDISFEVEDGSMVSLIGANGSGKSTTLKSLIGLIAPESGEILFQGENLLRLNPAERVKRGMVLCPEGRQIFPQMTVEINLKLGAYTRRVKELGEDYERVYELFPILRDRKKQMAATLSGGEQQMLALGRALMSSPRLLMLDEPSLGLAPIIVQQIFRLLRQINQMGTTILLVEQNARMALGISDKAHVFETGRIVLSDTGERLKNNHEMIAAYLGD